MAINLSNMKINLITLLVLTCLCQCFSQKYQNFKVSVYCTASDVDQMGDTAGFLLPRWNEISRQLKVDKVYIETHRDLFIVDQKTLDAVKKFFIIRRIAIAGGITFTIKESDHFHSFCYNDPEDRKRVKEISEYTAKNFDEITRRFFLYQL